MRYHLLGLDRSLPSVILYIGKTSSITAGANLGGGQEDLVPEVVQPFWGWYQIWYHGLVPDVVPPFGAGTKDVVPGLVPDVVQQPFQKIYQIWIMVWYQGLVPDVVPLFGTGTRDVVSGLVPPFWGWNERCGTRRVAQPFWAGTGSGTTAWYQGMVLGVVRTFGAGTRDVVVGSVPFRYGIWYHGLVWYHLLGLDRLPCGQFFMSEKLLPNVVQPWYHLLEASIRPGTRSGTTFTAYFITVRGGHQDPDLVPEIWYQIAKQAPIQPRKAVPDLVPAEYHGGGPPWLGLFRAM